MENSWCKVVDGQIVDGPRAWDNNTPPDQDWLPHSLEEPSNTINDKYDGSRLEVRGSQVIEVKLYSPKSAEQIEDEVNSIKRQAEIEVAYATLELAKSDLPKRDEWEAFKAAWQQLTDITELSWDYKMPLRPGNR